MSRLEQEAIKISERWRREQQNREAAAAEQQPDSEPDAPEPPQPLSRIELRALLLTRQQQNLKEQL